MQVAQIHMPEAKKTYLYICHRWKWTIQIQRKAGVRKFFKNFNNFNALRLQIPRCLIERVKKFVL